MKTPSKYARLALQIYELQKQIDVVTYVLHEILAEFPITEVLCQNCNEWHESYHIYHINGVIEKYCAQCIQEDSKNLIKQVNDGRCSICLRPCTYKMINCGECPKQDHERTLEDE